MADKSRMTLDQQRAHHALQRVTSHADAVYKKEYRAYVRSLPLQIIMSGLGQTIAQQFAATASGGQIGPGHEAVLKDILSWVGSSQNGWSDTPYKEVGYRDNDDAKRKTKALLDAIMKGNEAAMLRAQVELMAYLKWLKTFAEAMIDPDDKKHKDSVEEQARG